MQLDEQTSVICLIVVIEDSIFTRIPHKPEVE